jgi:DNA-binding transcriptional regulator LsrR (DeoR family)
VLRSDEQDRVPESVKGPAQLVLTASVARRYYVDGMSKVDIAADLKISRFKVARLLDLARATGLVRIDIGYPGALDVELSARVQDAFGLQHAIVITTGDDDQVALRREVGRAAAELLPETVTSSDVLGLGWARSLIAMSAQLHRLARCSVVQLNGALSRPDVDDSSIELVREVARVGGGPAFYFYAPMIVPDAATATALLRQPEVARAVASFGSVTKAVVGVGSWDPPYSTVYDAISPAERRSLRALGVRADVSGVLLDADGESVHAPLTERIIGIRAPELRAIPEVIGIAYGQTKARAVRAAIAGGYVTGLVTHATLAEAIVAEPA